MQMVPWELLGMRDQSRSIYFWFLGQFRTPGARIEFLTKRGLSKDLVDSPQWWTRIRTRNVWRYIWIKVELTGFRIRTKLLSGNFCQDLLPLLSIHWFPFCCWIKVSIFSDNPWNPSWLQSILSDAERWWGERETMVIELCFRSAKGRPVSL